MYDDRYGCNTCPDRLAAKTTVFGFERQLIVGLTGLNQNMTTSANTST